MSSKFRNKYKEMQDDLEKRQQESHERRDEGAAQFGSIFIKENIPKGVEFWTPDEGKHVIDIIPFFAGPNHPRNSEGDLCYMVDVWVHQNVGVMNDHYICNARMYKQPCPICEWIAENRPDKPIWNKIKPKRRVAYLVWVHDTEKMEKKGIQIMEIAYFFMEEKLDEISLITRTGKKVNFAHIDKGKSIGFTKKKSGKFEDSEGAMRDSTEILGHHFEEREEPIPNEIIDQVFCLDDCINTHPDYEEVKEAFLGRIPTKKKQAKEEDDEPAPRKRKDEPEDDVPNFSSPKKQVEDDEPPRRRRASSEDDEIPKERMSRRREPEPEDEEPAPRRRRAEPEDDEPAPRRRAEPEDDDPPPKKKQEQEPASKKRKKGESERCVYGGEFGATTDTMKSCKKCEIWDECVDEFDKKNA